MMILITYDINTETAAGRKRLRKVAKECVNYGHRVQNSVFECVLNEAEYRILKDKLENLIDKDSDSLRYYRLGDNYKLKTETSGKDSSLNVEKTLIF